MTTIAETLEERGKRYGEFTGHAAVSQSIQEVMMSHEGGKFWEMENDQKEALTMIAHKIGRIINGDPNYSDSWADIAGYATLVANRLESESNKTASNK